MFFFYKEEKGAASAAGCVRRRVLFFCLFFFPAAAGGFFIRHSRTETMATHAANKKKSIQWNQNKRNENPQKETKPIGDDTTPDGNRGRCVSIIGAYRLSARRWRYANDGMQMSCQRQWNGPVRCGPLFVPNRKEIRFKKKFKQKKKRFQFGPTICSRSLCKWLNAYANERGSFPWDQFPVAFWFFGFFLFFGFVSVSCYAKFRRDVLFFCKSAAALNGFHWVFQRHLSPFFLLFF